MPSKSPRRHRVKKKAKKIKVEDLQLDNMDILLEMYGKKKQLKDEQ